MLQTASSEMEGRCLKWQNSHHITIIDHTIFIKGQYDGIHTACLLIMYFPTLTIITHIPYIQVQILQTVYKRYWLFQAHVHYLFRQCNGNLGLLCPILFLSYNDQCTQEYCWSWSETPTEIELDQSFGNIFDTNENFSQFRITSTKFKPFCIFTKCMQYISV